MSARIPALLLLASMVSACGSGGTDPVRPLTCDDFRFQEDAQSYFRTHGAAYLDPDGDGIVCDDLPRSGTAVDPAPGQRR